MVLVGAPAEPHPSPDVFTLIMRGEQLAGSLIGGIAETQEMLDFCAEHGIVSDIEIIPIQKINEAYERMLQERREVPLRHRHGVAEAGCGCLNPADRPLRRIVREDGFGLPHGALERRPLFPQEQRKFLPVNGQVSPFAVPACPAGSVLCMFSETWRLLKVALAGWWNDRAMSLGASIAFFTVFSLAPMLLAAIAVAGLVFGRDAAQGAIVAELGGMIGTNEASALEAMIASASDVGSGILGTAIGIVTFLLLVTGAVVELQDNLNIIWKTKPPASYGIMDFIRTRLASLALVLGIGFLLLVSLVIDTGVTAIGHYLEAHFSGATIILRFLNSLVAFAVATLLFAMMFKLLPAVNLRWSDVWTGSLVTALLFTLGKFLIGYYLGKSNVASSYGAAASIITILLWIYYSSLILLFGAEFTKAYAESRGSLGSGHVTEPQQETSREIPARSP